MKPKNDYHGFPESVKAFEKAGKYSIYRGRDGKTKALTLKIPGEYNGKKGNFEFMKGKDGEINHRYFQPSADQ